MPGKDRYPHLFLDEKYRSASGYTSHGSGGPRKSPVRLRVPHAERIAKSLDEAWKNAESSRHAIGLTTSQGVFLEFEINSKSDIPKTLDDRRTGIELRNVRVDGEGKEARKLATVFVPSDKRSHFLNQIQEYSSEDTPKGKPKRQAFVASVDDVRAAMLESFWTDTGVPLPGSEPVWTEAWLNDSMLVSRDVDQEVPEVVARFRELIATLGIPEQSDLAVLQFPERAVVLIQANREQLTRLISVTDDLAELRAAPELVSFFTERLTRAEQAELAKDLINRMRIESDPKVFVCILDGGVNRGHPLLAPILDEDNCHTVKPEWGKSDHREDGHGTAMAGLAAFGDLQAALDSTKPIKIELRLESSKLIPPPPEKNPKRLWGDYTSQAINRAEIKNTSTRVVCMAISSEEDMKRGRPSSWSGKVDSIISGADDDLRRLVIIAAGNTDDDGIHRNYPHGLRASSVQDPGQAWNALTVGAFTTKHRIDPDLDRGFEAIAPPGSLSPYSSTSDTWEQKWPIKPEIVLEGGNVGKGPNNSVMKCEDLQLVSTSAHLSESYFCSFQGTSAASAQAAWMAAKIQAAYPEMWPETVRALLVHSANWTSEMERLYLDGGKKKDYSRLARNCGYGVPNLERAISCFRNSLTLIAEAEIQPFDQIRNKQGQSVRVTKEMHLYALPWPKEELMNLGEAVVKMRVTLSYFVEPSPGEVGWKDRYRYASHGLRFELNHPGEERKPFEKRVNKKALEDGEKKPTGTTVSEYWIIGEARDTGSLHSDIWTGTAADLAASNLVAVYPVGGWWKERHQLNRWGKGTRYSLIISIETPSEEVNIYSPVSAQVGIPTPIPIEIEIGV